MMKKLSIIFACILVAMMSCTKSKEVHPEIGDGNDEIVTVGIKDVHVEYTRTDHVDLSRVVFHYCPADANGNAQQFEATEMTKKETFFELTLNDLLSDTLYWYYYELFPNGGDAFNTVEKTFRTQTYDTPEPPEPPTPPSNVPEGAIDGLFTINENGDQVYFSKGNLQYQASTNTWRFAEKQWDFVGGTDYITGVFEGNVEGSTNNDISSDYSGWIDLFGWGTSGYNHGAFCYQPWSTSQNTSDYYAYGNETSNLFDQTGQADWGYNAISNGGNLENSGWRTLTNEEWGFIFNDRHTSSGIRWAKATVNEVKGIILLPDGWTEFTYALFNTNGGSFGSNTVTAIEWMNYFEIKGAVFLPVTGDRWSTTVQLAGPFGILGSYWSSSYSFREESGCIDFSSENLSTNDDGARYAGMSVRLVQDAKQ